MRWHGIDNCPNGFHLVRGREASHSEAKRNPPLSRNNSTWQTTTAITTTTKTRTTTTTTVTTITTLATATMTMTAKPGLRSISPARPSLLICCQWRSCRYVWLDILNIWIAPICHSLHNSVHYTISFARIASGETSFDFYGTNFRLRWFYRQHWSLMPARWKGAGSSWCFHCISYNKSDDLWLLW